MRHYNCYEFPVGVTTIVADDTGICGIYFTDQWKESFGTKKETPSIYNAYIQLEEYFSGKRKAFDMPLSFQGTAFQVKVWKELMKIPYGQTATYKEIAQRINHPKAYRAVGMANHVNCLPIVIPCHRVIGANGKMVGYAGGIDIKEKLLELEQRNM